MKQVLSQQEIDSLLNALNTGEIDPDAIKEEEEKNKVRSYDFRRPIKLSKEYINTLHMIFENFSKISANLLSTQIRTNVNIAVGAVEQISYDEFIHSIPNPTLMGIFHSKPLNGNQVLEINPQFCLQVIELMCGGSESKSNKSATKKEKFTDIELGILEDIVLSILKSFESAWSEIIDIETEIDSLETNPQLVQNMSPNEPVVLISFSVEVFESNSFINICIPYVSFENITDKLSIRSWFDFEKDTGEENKDLLSQRLMTSIVNLEVSLGKSSITVDDFLQLEVGDILQLDMKTTDPLKMYVEDKLHYVVKPGESNGKIAVQVLQYIEEDVEQ
ncbi:flagellar motor switch protein FliM [Alkalibaculum sp. M08DMB]|uniref:Flagellar motor switch protein FliM n=1 Tax=Alkalibaculum sporogenes TaxID=2655001 RepID=A0A6A7K6I0_9FIRM|nr:flagellar motor switch protein FliM [Alkalibaculum sporogenes]MPW24763.1 flagellar motor switch protein FliM [Alkalibaculum sporogenes]